jgi:hypothetical protein
MVSEETSVMKKKPNTLHKKKREDSLRASLE